MPRALEPELLSTSDPMNPLVGPIGSRLAEVLLLEVFSHLWSYGVKGDCFLAGVSCPAYTLGARGSLGTLV